MASDLSTVTATLKNLVNFVLAENGESTVTATAAPPDATSSENLVSVYLYHVLESPEFKNLPPTKGTGPVPIQHAPMGLVLQYIITVIHGASDTISNDAVMAEQRILGFIARAIHDFPVITEATRVGTSAQILHPDIAAQRNSIRLNLRPATREETVSFWSSSDDKLPRLSLFVEARVAILEPRAPTILPGIVLTVGNFVFPGAGPQLTTTRNQLGFEAPSLESGTLENRLIGASPARGTLLPLGSLPVPLPVVAGENDIVNIDAVGIRPGRHFLTLRGPDGEFTLDMSSASNPDWAFEVTSDLVRFRARRSAVTRQGETVVLDFGVYSARVTVEAAQFGNKPQSSNEAPFALIPQILALTPVGTNTYELRIAGEYFWITPPPGTPAINVDDIVLAVQGVALTAVAHNAALVPGRFQIATTAPNTPTDTLRFLLPTELTAPPAPPPSLAAPLSIGLIVKGAAATPGWITVPAP